ncbi:MAG TPA: hypothetical protein VN238_15705 [Solirubrobacteraceae bacterium]|nr:hypothetical protein [Solirubrobacteraceae bacterium]
MSSARRFLTFAVACCAALLLVAAPASADDKSVSDAWDSEDAAFTQLGKSERREYRAWEKRGFTRDPKLLKIYRRGETLSRKVIAALEAQQPSTPQGAQARDLAISSTKHFAEHFVVLRKFVRTIRADDETAGRKIGKEADRLLKLTESEGEQAKAIFVQLGLD